MENERKEDKTMLLRIINALQFLICMIAGVVLWVSGEVGIGLIVFVAGFVTLVFIKGFQDIIDLLNSINNKLK